MEKNQIEEGCYHEEWISREDLIRFVPSSILSLVPSQVWGDHSSSFGNDIRDHPYFSNPLPQPPSPDSVTWTMESDAEESEPNSQSTRVKRGRFETVLEES